MAKKPGRHKAPIIPWHIGESEKESKWLQTELDIQTDRGAGVLGGSFLEWRVKQAIRTRLYIWDKEAEKIFGTDERGGELGFMDQCRMAYSLRLVGAEGLKDLERVARVRNRFAHHLSVKSFKDQRVSGLCKALRTPEIFYEMVHRLDVFKPPEDSRQRYIASVRFLDMMLYSAAVSGVPRWPKLEKDAIFW